MALPPSTANWHWKNKNVTRWGTQWFEHALTSITINGDQEGETVSISKVTEVDGDIELGQRKSKLITIFDCKVEMQWTGTTSDGTEVKGTLTIPEVSHEIICDKLSDFVFNWTLTTSSSPEVDAVYKLAKTRLPTALETKLASFPSAIIDTHGKDLTVSADPSRSGSPAPAAAVSLSSSAAHPATAASPSVKKADEKKVNTTSVVVEATLQASADDLFSLLTDEKRIPMWTRAPAQSNPQPGAEFSLFGGGVKGKYISLTPSKEIVQSWALQSPTWPSGHSATLTTTLDQSTDSTKVKFNLTGVPTGTEDEIKRNLEGYYIHGFKSIGLGTEL
ncbi:activator of Hsp90 ATPase [Crucibulum laeve]|uniref:Activator of Hsp90 ATPase n=1 Tax=Crucibulum laeve TaxID=68775 RepID=A0A5C3LT92_9AGAR|nr:activator of Hsp90 ATPase [Crucibulum laeve]